MGKHTLYGVALSYYTGKASSYLRWKGVDFEERPADRHFYQNICLPRIGYPMIPVLITDEGQCIQDTTKIMDHFEAQAAGPCLTPTGTCQKLATFLIELYADEWLLLPAMHYRWYYDEASTLLEFGFNMLPHGSEAEQRAIGEKLAAPFRGSLPSLGIHAENKEAIEASWVGLLKDLDNHFRVHDFLLGARPSTADFSLIGGLYAHLFRDATAGALMRNEALAVARYVERMIWPAQQTLGEYLPDDQVPDTLYPVFSRMMTEQMPVLIDSAQQLAQWKKENPDRPIPRSIGLHDFTLGGITTQRAMRPYSTWLHGRAKNFYDAHTTTNRQELDAFLVKINGHLFRDTAIAAPVTYANYRTAWA